jgi:hypothetical protein
VRTRTVCPQIAGAEHLRYAPDGVRIILQQSCFVKWPDVEQNILRLCDLSDIFQVDFIPLARVRKARRIENIQLDTVKFPLVLGDIGRHHPFVASLGDLTAHRCVDS